MTLVRIAVLVSILALSTLGSADGRGQAAIELTALAPAPRGPLDGVWRMTTTAQDLRSAGTPAREIVPENYGRFTYVIDRGRLAFTQEDKPACTWGYGKLELQGRRMQMRFIDGGGISPNGVVKGAGKLYIFGWVLRGGQLTLTPVKGAVSPPPTRAKPWRRISATPSRAYFSKRCPPPKKALAPPEATRTPLDGVWEVTMIPEDLRAIGTPESDIVPENYGAFVYVLDRDRFAFTQENEDACTWGYGKLKVWDHKMQWLFIDGGGISPNGAYNRPYELFVFGWSLYRDVLTLTPVKGAVSPPPTRAKPWRQVSTTPSREHFSKRCPPPQAALP